MTHFFVLLLFHSTKNQIVGPGGQSWIAQLPNATTQPTPTISNYLGSDTTGLASSFYLKIVVIGEFAFDLKPTNTQGGKGPSGPHQASTVHHERAGVSDLFAIASNRLISPFLLKLRNQIATSETGL
jgi:hypothetical protein